jgi:hypothetical protein
VQCSTRKRDTEKNNKMSDSEQALTIEASEDKTEGKQVTLNYSRAQF